MKKMTYCCALRLKDGLVFISDTRTNAGVDQISVFRKLYTFGKLKERFIAIQTGKSGNNTGCDRSFAKSA
jgi:putative proteasome-type protease